MLPALPSGVQYGLQEAIKILCAHKVLVFPMELRHLVECSVGHFMEVQHDVQSK